mmetsp:Transcript_40994/g.128999  ORF Transcript_40994/g.128999 Transcript_40994/m.128999 type:complete len:81 (+) Transcript_40994:234-476(+)
MLQRVVASSASTVVRSCWANAAACSLGKKNSTLCILIVREVGSALIDLHMPIDLRDCAKRAGSDARKEGVGKNTQEERER